MRFFQNLWPSHNTWTLTFIEKYLIVNFILRILNGLYCCVGARYFDDSKDSPRFDFFRPISHDFFKFCGLLTISELQHLFDNFKLRILNGFYCCVGSIFWWLQRFSSLRLFSPHFPRLIMSYMAQNKTRCLNFDPHHLGLCTAFNPKLKRH